MTVNELIERLQSLTEEQKGYQVAYFTYGEDEIFVDVIPEYSLNLDIPIVSLI